MSWKVKTFLEKMKGRKSRIYLTDVSMLCVGFLHLRNAKVHFLAWGKLSLLQFVSNCKIIASKTTTMNF